LLSGDFFGGQFLTIFDRQLSGLNLKGVVVNVEVNGAQLEKNEAWARIFRCGGGGSNALTSLPFRNGRKSKTQRIADIVAPAAYVASDSGKNSCL
jgi:hypothetical protein